MLCENCKKNEATTFIKRIVNGRLSEYPLCDTCASAFGYGDVLGLGLRFRDFIENYLSSGDLSSMTNRGLRCDKCGSTIEDIVRSGKVGCADCYRIFGDKLDSAVRHIHGRSVYSGTKAPIKTESNTSEEKTDPDNDIREQLKKAVARQDYEEAERLSRILRGAGGKDNG